MSSSNEPPGGPAGPGRAASADHRPEGDRGRERARRPARKPSRARRRLRRRPSRRAGARRWPGCRRISPGRWWRPAPAARCSSLAVLALAGVFSSRDDSVHGGRYAARARRAADARARRETAAGRGRRQGGRRSRRASCAARNHRRDAEAPIADPALANRIATLEGDLKALGERVGVLGRRNDEIASIAGEARTRADAAAAAVAELKKVPRGRARGEAGRDRSA